MLCYFFIVDFSFKKVISSLCEGDLGVYGIAVLGFFSSGISVILILLMCGIAVSSSPTVCIFFYPSG